MSKRRPSIHTALTQRVPAQSRVLAAVSGGRDSMVLVHGLLQVRRLCGLHVEVCHVNHHLRESSSADANFVREWCEAQHIECHVIHLKDRPKGENLESWARAQRYAAFQEVMSERSLDLVCTAHTANDVAETLLMRLIANKELTSIEESDPRRRCLRPLAHNTRVEINEYVKRWKLGYVEDPTNQDVTFVRNRVRHELLPLLAAKFDPSIVWNLAERARSLAADCNALDAAAVLFCDAIGSLREGDAEWLRVLCERLKTVHPAVQWRSIQMLLTPYFGHTIGEAKARTIIDVIVGEGGVVQMGDGRSIRAGRKTGLQIGKRGSPGS